MYFKNLDATRFFSCITVFLHHTIISSDAANSPTLYRFYDANLSVSFVIGLDYYVVLSGFLISWVILEEYKYTSRFNILHYYLRRILRTWPLYFLLVALGYVIIWYARSIMGLTVHDMPPLKWTLSFLLNFFIVKHGMAFLFFIAFLWSICVEEQFYAVWGILLKWGKRFFPLACVILIVTPLLFRALSLHTQSNLFFNSLNWTGNFATGGLMAYFCINGGTLFEKFKKIPKTVIAVVYVLFILNAIFYKYIYASDIMTIFERMCISLFFSFIIFEQSFCENRLFEFGKYNFLSYLGKIAYGLFIFHGPVTLLFEKVTTHFNWPNTDLTLFFINPVLIFVITLGIAAMSYKYFEKPIMSLRYKFRFE